MKKGFTLIELLVVIAIIGSLSALFLPNFMAARERARDSQRKSDLRQIQKALELYKQDQSPVSFPASVACDSATCVPNSGSQWINASTNSIYMNKVPIDPNRTANDGYYFYSEAGNLTYLLCACLENKADPDGVAADCSSSYTCTSGKSYNVIQP